MLSYQGRELDLTPPWRRATLAELIAEHAGVEVELSMGVENLQRVAARLGVPFEPWYGPGKLMLEIYEKTTEAELWGPVFVCDYPQEVSPLARAHRSKPGYVERFEPIIAGRELGNAFSELTDPDEQRARFEDQERERALGDDEAMAIDWDYLRALELGHAADRRPRARHRPPRDALRRRARTSERWCSSRRCAPRRGQAEAAGRPTSLQSES